MKNIVNELVPQIETQLNQKLSKQKETVVSIILAWNDDHTAIQFWFESEWNDFSNPYGAPNLIISCSTFAKLIDAIATGKLKEIETDFNEEKVDFQNFGNLLMFSDPIKNKLASEVIDLANYSLIAITKQMCKRKNLTPSKSLLSFKITNLGCYVS